jgi:AraC family transcriptional regulator, regulatory protein of adaptative response / DNA-3-methyladenine glycosylase II
MVDADNDARGAAASMRFSLAYRPPYDWDAMLGFLDARAIAGVERIEAGVYKRTLAVGGNVQPRAGWLSVRHAPRRHALRVELSLSLAGVSADVLRRLQHAFDVDRDPAPIVAALGPLAKARPGLRVPGTCDGFELAVRAVIGQQVSVAGARTLLGRLACAFGAPLDGNAMAGLSRLFPSAEAVAAHSSDQLRTIGLTTSRARTLRDLAHAVACGDIALHPGADVQRTCQALEAIRGIGPWTSGYVAMRALGCADAFPEGDLGVLHAMCETRPAAARRRSEAWRPWRAYAVMHLWQCKRGTFT